MEGNGYRFNHAWYEQLVGGYDILLNAEASKNVRLDPSTRRTIVEIGVYEGASSCWWLDNFMEHAESRLVCIDPFTGNMEQQMTPEAHPTLADIEQIAKTNIAKSKYPGKATILKGCSWDVFPTLENSLPPPIYTDNRPIDILYIDGEHTTEAVMRDMLLYVPLVRPGGLVVMDDYGNEKVKRAVDYVRSAINYFETSYFTGWQLWSARAL